MPKQESSRLTATEANKTRELENILEANQRIASRLSQIDERLGMMSGRLSGELPREVASEGSDSPPAGIIGQFKTTQSSIFCYCDSIDEWLNNIERVV